MSNLPFKILLHQYCRDRLQDRIDDLEQALASIAEARNNETKSSVGDKYETGRAMMQLEEEKYRSQLANMLDTANKLERIDPQEEHSRVEPGSLVITDNGRYYLTIGLGKVKLEGELCYVISSDSPVGQALWLKVKGESVVFNQKAIKILDIH